MDWAEKTGRTLLKRLMGKGKIQVVKNNAGARTFHPSASREGCVEAESESSSMKLLNLILEWMLSISLRDSVLVMIIHALQRAMQNVLPASLRYALWVPVLVRLLVTPIPFLSDIPALRRQ